MPAAELVVCPADIDAVVVDLDGVVTDTARVHADAWAEMFDAYLAEAAPLGAPFDRDRDYLQFIDGKARADGVAAFLASRHIDLPRGEPTDPPTATTVHGLGKRKDELFRERLRRDGVGVFASTVDLLRGMRTRGAPLAVVSASRNCQEVLASAGLADFFDVVIDGNVAADLGLAGKPDPATFLEAARRLRVVPGRMVLVEDAIAGVEAGRRGGFGIVVGVDRHHHPDDLRAAGADVVVGDLADLPVDWAAPCGGWTITRDAAAGEPLGRPIDALFALSDGTIGIRDHLTLVAGAFGLGGAADDIVRLLPGPSLAPLYATDQACAIALRRTLDMRTGTVSTRPLGGARGVTARRFVSLTRPGLVVQIAEGPVEQQWTDAMLSAPLLDGEQAMAAKFDYVELPPHGGDGRCAQTRSDRTQITAVGRQRTTRNAQGSRLERLIVVRTGVDARQDAETVLAEAWTAGVDVLEAEQRQAWAQRWDVADIEIDGDPSAQQAIRFALFHLLSCAPLTGEAAVGARGLTGLGYAGHVFWDADVFVLPVLAATLPAAARAMLEYRVRRLPVARENAHQRGRPGARFPWESADSGHEATPSQVRDFHGDLVSVLTGDYEEHITSDVAWAALRYAEWSGDTGFVAGAGHDLVVDTARYMASHIRVDSDGSGHIDRVMGPDEYHEVVDDNAFTNLLASWHLRRAADLVAPAAFDVADRWRQLADALVTGYDQKAGRYEQFDGFSHLEALRITDVADVPIAADVLLGHDRVSKAQVIKQPDVLMAHYMLPAEMVEGSLGADLDFYLPRTAHGSSLSPAVCATLLARAGRSEEALALFDIAAGIDLDDLTAMTAGGLHLATCGGLWQAVVGGFAGMRVVDGSLCIDPVSPGRWNRLAVRVRFQSAHVRIEITEDAVTIESDRPAALMVHGVALDGSGTVTRVGGIWRKQ